MSTQPADLPYSELRPLTMGEILDRTAQLYRSNFVLFVGIAVFPRALQLVWQLIQLSVTRYLTAHHLPTTLFAIGGGLVGLVFLLVFVGLGVAATNRAVSDIYLGLPTSIAQSYREVRPHWFRYLLVMLAVGLYAWGPTLVPYIGIFAAMGMMGMNIFSGQPAVAVPAGTPNMLAIGIVGLSGLSLLLTVPYGIWMTLRYSLAVPASIFENLAVHASLKRSVFLTKKGLGRVFLLVLLVGVVSWVVLVAAQMPFLIPTMRAAFAKRQPPFWALIGSGIMSFLTTSVIGPVYGIAITLFYYDERIRKEGFDIEWMMRRANLPVAPLLPLELPPTEPSPTEPSPLSAEAPLPAPPQEPGLG